jgi:hypothetical protein
MTASADPDKRSYLRVHELPPVADAAYDAARRHDAVQGSALLLREIRAYQRRHEGAAS